MLQLPFRQMFVLPNHYVNDYAWKPEHEVCEWSILIHNFAFANYHPSASNIDLRERLLGRLVKIYSSVCSPFLMVMLIVAN